jgi:large subunit ribosomal protein L21
LYVVVRAGGKQFRVEEGQTITVDGRLEPGTTVELETLAFADGDAVRLGSPRVDGVSVTGEVIGSRKGPKIDILRYKSKVRHRKRMGYRPERTDIRIMKISVS